MAAVYPADVAQSYPRHQFPSLCYQTSPSPPYFSLAGKAQKVLFFANHGN
ncbi:hypothetical protein JK215_10140 [Tatumella sp. JGM100]|nr:MULTISPECIES: hypothetical protein [unclassified Tatumella]MBS0856884.1 hypothetical protein [Tatumella sp. JGM16]MBS0902220.1 hypothetical protein [Tatumella sp. JGM100]